MITNKSRNIVPVANCTIIYTFFCLVVKIVSRDEWCALPPKGVESMSNPVPFVVIHHSATPEACTTQEGCVEAMRSMQIYHQETQGWYDIGYSFAVGGDFRAYEGRGWAAVGAHAPGYNDKSIGICVIGDWRGKTKSRHDITCLMVTAIFFRGATSGEAADCGEKPD